MNSLTSSSSNVKETNFFSPLFFSVNDHDFCFRHYYFPPLIIKYMYPFN